MELGEVFSVPNHCSLDCSFGVFSSMTSTKGGRCQNRNENNIIMASGHLKIYVFS